jgi:hypothetical protein
MLARVLAFGLFLAAMTATLAVSDPAEAADDAKVAKKKKKAAKKKQMALDTAALFKKLDTNGDSKLDMDEFKKLFGVQPEPKGKKGAPLGPFDLDFTFKSLDANGDKLLSAEEFKGIVPAVFPARKK